MPTNKGVEDQGAPNAAEAHADRLLTAALRALDGLASLGSNDARHAAAILRGRRAGRKSIDDTEALADVARLVAAGKRRAAVGIVARGLAAREGIATASVARRLRRHLSEKSGQTISSVSARR